MTRAAQPRARRSRLRTVDFTAVEIFEVGHFDAMTGPIDVTGEMLDGLVATYEATKGTLVAPLKIGHAEDDNMQPEGMPALGRVVNLRRVGDKLLADVVGVPGVLADLLEDPQGPYPNRSVEIRYDLEVGDVTYPIALTALSVLGADQPAVKTLAPLSLEDLEDVAALYAKAPPVLSFRGARIQDDRPIETPSEPAVVSAAQGTHAGARPMDLSKIAAVLGLAATATEQEIIDAISALSAKEAPAAEAGDKPAAAPAAAPAAEAGSAAGAPAVVAAESQLRVANAEIARLRAADLARSAQADVTAKASLIDAAIAAGKFLPAQRGGLLRMSEKVDVAVLTEVLASQPVAVDLEVRGRDVNADAVTLTPAEVRAADAAGIDHKKILEGKRILLAKTAAAR